MTNDTSSFVSKDGNKTKELMDAMVFEAESLAKNYIAKKKLDASIHKAAPLVAELKCFA